MDLMTVGAGLGSFYSGLRSSAICVQIGGGVSQLFFGIVDLVYTAHLIATFRLRQSPVVERAFPRPRRGRGTRPT